LDYIPADNKNSNGKSDNKNLLIHMLEKENILDLDISEPKLHQLGKIINEMCESILYYKEKETTPAITIKVNKEETTIYIETENLFGDLEYIKDGHIATKSKETMQDQIQSFVDFINKNTRKEIHDIYLLAFDNGSFTEK
jgi:hypothetical protein